MAEEPKIDRGGFLEEVQRNLDNLSHPAKAAFAVRCAWRSCPLLVCGWKNEANKETWLHHSLQNIQAEAFAALLAMREQSHAEIPNFVFSLTESISRPDSQIATMALQALEDASMWAGAVWVATPMKAADYSIDAYMARFADSNSASIVRAIFRAMEADLLRLRSGTAPSAVFEYPLLDQVGEDPDWPLREVDALWHESITAGVDSAPDFWNSLNRIWHGQPDWTYIEARIHAWLKGGKQAKPKTIVSRRQYSEQPSEPLPTIQPRRIIQQRLVSTTSVTTDGEAEKLTPTAQRCMLALREFLVSDETRPPLTVAMEAPWGGGKSSLMRHLQGALANEVDAKTKERRFKNVEPIPTVWFNPWKHEAGKTLWAAFAVAFERQMAERCGFWERTWKRVSLSWERLEPMEKIQLVLRFAFWIGAFVALCYAAGVKAGAVTDWRDQLLQHAPWLGMIVTVWAFLRDVVKQLGSPLKLDVSRLLTHNDHMDKVDDLHRFHEDFRRLMRAYIPKRQNGVPGKAVVFIDDLDRCEAPKAAELLQSLHQMLNVQERSRADADQEAPGVICVLGMDREKVAAAVAAKHEKLLPLLIDTEGPTGKVSRADAMKFGHEFLEKFIQLTLHLPAMQGRDLDEYLASITVVHPAVKGPPFSIPVSSVAAASQNGDASKILSRSPDKFFADLAAETIHEHREQKKAEERIEKVTEDLGDGSVALQCARYVSAALENNPRKLKQFVNLFRLRLYLAAAMNFLDLPDRDAENSDVEPFRTVPQGKLSVHHLAKLVALELAAPAEMATIREKRPEQMYRALEASFPADTKPVLYDLVASRDVFEPQSYDLAKAGLDAYFHFFRAEATQEQGVST
jgi:hypothetical protein